MAVGARLELLVDVCASAGPTLDVLHERGIFRPSGEVVGGVFVPNNRLLAFVMLLGEAGVDATDDVSVAVLQESCTARGPQGRSAKLTNRGNRVGAALNRDGRHRSPAKLGPTYLRELADGLGLTSDQRLRLAKLNDRLAQDPATPFQAADVASEVRKRRDGAYPLRPGRNLADDPPPTGETVDRTGIREQCEDFLARQSRDARPRPLVLCGPSGSGKTALVGRLIDDGVDDRPHELGVWIHASSRPAILDGFARAATAIQRANPDASARVRGNPLFSSNPLLVANTVCDLLTSSERPWYVVLDDVADPADLAGLALPGGRAGQTIVTSRWSLAGWPARFAAVRVGPYTPEEALQFLRMRLGPAVTSALLPHDALESSGRLAEALGHQPFSLDQATTTILRESLTCEEYRRRLDERHRDVDDVPPNERLAAANWLEGLARTSYRPPAGMEERLVLLAALCGPTAPVSLFMEEPALVFLGGGQALTADDARRGAVRLSTRGLLAFNYSQQEDPAPYLEHGTVRIHDIAKRAVLATYAALVPEAASVAARTLRRLWGDVERNPGRNAQLRICAQALVENAPETIWLEADTKKHVSEFIVRSLNTLGESGQCALTAERYAELAGEATERFDATHLATLELRGRAAVWHGRAGDIATSIAQLEAVVRDYALHEDKEVRHVRGFRQELAVNRGWAGDVQRAIDDLDVVIAEWATDPESEEATLRAQYLRAIWLGRAGRPRAAFDELERLLPLRREHMGEDRLGILRTRLQIEIWRARTAMVENKPDLGKTAIAHLSFLVADWVRVAGRDHPDTLRARRHLAMLRARSGDAAALPELEDVHAASLTLFGPTNPDTLRSAAELALAHGRLGGWQVALNLLGELVEDAGDVGTATPQQLRICYDHACALAEVGRHTEAVVELQRVLERQHETLSAEHPDITDSERRLQELLQR